MKLFFTTCFLFPLLFCLAQQPARQVLNSCGKTYSTTQVRMKISVGEPIVGIHSTSSGGLSQGFFTGKPTVVIPPVDTPVAFPPGYRIYPNPFNNVLRVKGDYTKVKQMQLVDIAGRRLTMFPVVNGEANLEGLNAGVYLARLLGDNNSILYFVKLVKL